jgi:hypothetical protein
MGAVLIIFLIFMLIKLMIDEMERENDENR